MINQNSKEKDSLKKKRFVSYLLIIFITIISVFIVFCNGAYNYPGISNQLFLIWITSDILTLFIALFIILGIYTFLFVNYKNFSFKRFLSIKNYLIIALTTLFILANDYEFTFIQNKTTLTQTLENCYVVLAGAFISLFILIGIFSLMILSSINKK